MRSLLAILTLIPVAIAAKKDEEVKPNDLSHGFGDDIEWVSWNDAQSLSEATGKPMFLLIHKSWCGACQALKTTFRVSTRRDDFVRLTKEFIMVNLEDDEEPEDETYAPDGKYIPRIFFLDTKGKLIDGTDNAKQYPRNKHYYAQIPDLMKTMKKALDTMNALNTPSKEEDTEEPMKPEKDEEKKKAKSTTKKDQERTAEEDEFSGCPHAAKARAAKKEKEAQEKKLKETKQVKEKRLKGDKTDEGQHDGKEDVVAEKKNEKVDGKADKKKESGKTDKKAKKDSLKQKSEKLDAEGKTKKKGMKGDSGKKTEL